MRVRQRERDRYGQWRAQTRSISYWFFSFYFYFAVLGIELKTLCMPDKSSITQLHSSPTEPQLLRQSRLQTLQITYGTTTVPPDSQKDRKGSNETRQDRVKPSFRLPRAGSLTASLNLCSIKYLGHSNKKSDTQAK